VLAVGLLCAADMAHPSGTLRSQYPSVVRVFVTATAYRRRAAFRDALTAQHVISELLRTSQAARVEVSAYCVMPDHVHILLAGLNEDSCVPLAVRTWKQATGYWYRKQRSERLWEPNYWDRALRQRDHSREILEYMLSDPLRSGLVQRLQDYPFIGSVRWTQAELIAFGEAGFAGRSFLTRSIPERPG
jgi:putative transposase